MRWGSTFDGRENEEKNEKNQDSACSEKIREMLKSLLFGEKTKIHNNKHCLTKSVVNPLIQCVIQIKNMKLVIFPLQEHILTRRIYIRMKK